MTTTDGGYGSISFGYSGEMDFGEFCNSEAPQQMVVFEENMQKLFDGIEFTDIDGNENVFHYDETDTISFYINSDYRLIMVCKGTTSEERARAYFGIIENTKNLTMLLIESEITDRILFSLE